MSDRPRRTVGGNSVWERAKAAADRTPETRNRAVDFYRAVSIGAVVLGHWLLAAPHVTAERELRFGDLFHVAPWTVWLTWIFQVMPIFFMVGGFSNGASWESARRKQTPYEYWLSARLRRLVGPVVPLVLLWAALAALARQLGLDARTLAAGSQPALGPTWFLAVYLLVVAAGPLSHAGWSRFGVSSILALAGCAAAVDAIGMAGGVEWLRWINYGFVWLAIHQLGYAWRSGRIDRRVALALSAAGLGALILLTTVLGYPVGMITVPGEERSNTSPPTVAPLALALFQLGLLIAFERPLRAWLQRRESWAATILVNRSIMTVYLWHMTVLVLVLACSAAAGGFGLRLEPGSALWWASRPVWVAVLGLLLLPAVALLRRFELTAHQQDATPPPAWASIAGALLLCSGLGLLAPVGIANDSATGVRLLPVALVIFGAVLVLRGDRLTPATSRPA
ncbi:MAG: Acyltransferase family protein [Thermomicrobiales bacterium]|jgi:fucose 4-O-acetylase-like acetyltransferase|nr:Acyltransferase family protein [Thermomicrobiales bacterium]